MNTPFSTCLRLLICLIATVKSLAALADVRGIDTLSLAEHTDAYLDALKPVDGNPALEVRRYATSLSRIAATAENHWAVRPFFHQLGQGQKTLLFAADSHLRLSANTAVWGLAEYAAGERRRVKWNSTADFLLLYPYVMADTLGGNLTFERYAFKAGWASAWKKIKIGAEARFRAEHEYRTTDPRPRNIVTDLTLLFGASAPLLASHELGLTGGLRFYKQTNNVAFLREAGVIPEYHMLGLGMDYKRFSGNNASAYYKATGCEVGIDLVPTGKRGLMFSTQYAYTPYHRILPNLNALPISVLGVQTLKGEVGWRQGQRDGWLLKAAVCHERRTGNEQIAGSSSSTEYRIVDELTTYRARGTTLQASALYAQQRDHTSWNVALSAGIMDYAAHYVFPERRLSFSKATVEAKGQWQRLLPRRNLLSVNASVAYHAALSSSMQMPYVTMSDANIALMNHTFASASASYVLSQAVLRWAMPLRRHSLFIELGGTLAVNDADNRAWSQRLSVGVEL